MQSRLLFLFIHLAKGGLHYKCTLGVHYLHLQQQERVSKMSEENFMRERDCSMEMYISKTINGLIDFYHFGNCLCSFRSVVDVLSYGEQLVQRCKQTWSVRVVYWSIVEQFLYKHSKSKSNGQITRFEDFGLPLAAVDIDKAFAQAAGVQLYPMSKQFNLAVKNYTYLNEESLEFKFAALWFLLSFLQKGKIIILALSVLFLLYLPTKTRQRLRLRLCFCVWP